MPPTLLASHALASSSSSSAASLLLRATYYSPAFGSQQRPLARHFSSSPHRAAEPASSQSPTSSSQQAAAAQLQKAGEGVTEGPHFRDNIPTIPSPSPSPSPSSSLASTNDLANPFHGPWTLSHPPVYTPSDLSSVRVVRRPFERLSDKVASGMVWSLRKGFDLVSMYKHVPMPTEGTWTTAELRKRGSTMTPDQWLMRIIFLESIAGVPGMVAGALRHLHSLRLMKRDGGWIHSLLEEAENERMHLMTFMTLAKPSFALRSLILLGQGVFYNLFFIGYLLSPRIAHRFVGCLEEEAVVTYTRCIEEVKAGHLPEWEHAPAPEIAISYWRLEKDATMLDVLENVRADESAHRFVNHTLANLKQDDFNPFALSEPPALVKGTVPGFSRAEAGDFAAQSRKTLEGAAFSAHAVEGGEKKLGSTQ